MRVIFAISALAAVGSALQQRDEAPTPTAPPARLNTVSILNILATAVPESLLELAYTNAPALSSVVASEFAAKQTPDWFGALPKDVQSYLIPATTVNQAPAIIISAMPTAVSISQGHATPTTARSSSIIYTGLPGNSTATGHIGAQPTTLSTSSRRTNATVFTTAVLSTGGAPAAAALPTGIIGTGLVGALGVAGLLAL